LVRKKGFWGGEGRGPEGVRKERFGRKIGGLSRKGQVLGGERICLAGLSQHVGLGRKKNPRVGGKKKRPPIAGKRELPLKGGNRGGGGIRHRVAMSTPRKTANRKKDLANLKSMHEHFKANPARR